MMAAQNSDVFISYHRTDDMIRLVTRFRNYAKETNCGLEMFQDSASIEPGEDWWTRITKALDETPIVIVMMNTEEIESPYVNYEWAYAKGKGHRVIPVFLNDGPFKISNPVLSGNQAYIKKEGQTYEHFFDGLLEQLVAFKKSLLREKSQPAQDLLKLLNTVEVLSHLGGSAGLNALIEMSKQTIYPPEVMGQIATALGSFNHANETREQAQAALIELAQRPNQDHQVYQQVAFELGKFAFDKNQHAVTALRDLVSLKQQSNAYVRKAAVESLQGYARWENQNAIDYLFGALSDPAIGVRNAAQKALKNVAKNNPTVKSELEAWTASHPRDAAEIDRADSMS